MSNKPVAVSPILPVTVAGILILAVLSTISSTNQVFAQKPTELTVGMSPDTTVAQKYHATGKLTSEGKGVGGATITFDWITGGNWKGVKLTSSTKTNSDGTYSNSPGSGIPLEGVKADYAGDSEHMPAHSAFSLTG
jgi:hypothetical protein